MKLALLLVASAGASTTCMSKSGWKCNSLSADVKGCTEIFGKTVVGYAVDLKKDFACKLSQSSGQCSCKLVPNAHGCKSITHWDGVTSRYGGTCDPAPTGQYSDLLKEGN